MLPKIQENNGEQVGQPNEWDYINWTPVAVNKAYSWWSKHTTKNKKRTTENLV